MKGGAPWSCPTAARSERSTPLPWGSGSTPTVASARSSRTHACRPSASRMGVSLSCTRPAASTTCSSATKRSAEKRPLSPLARRVSPQTAAVDWLLVEDYTNKYKGEQVEVALFGGDYQDGVLTAYCIVEDVPHIELNGHILVPLQNIASLHCSSRCDAPEPDWPPRGLAEDDGSEEPSSWA